MDDDELLNRDNAGITIDLDNCRIRGACVSDRRRAEVRCFGKHRLAWGAFAQHRRSRFARYLREANRVARHAFQPDLPVLQLQIACRRFHQLGRDFENALSEKLGRGEHGIARRNRASARYAAYAISD